MKMSLSLLSQLNLICSELRSEKVMTRNKAAERLDNILINSKVDLIAQLKEKSSSTEVSWSEIFNSAIQAILKHAAKLEESKDSKSIQTMLNKNYVFGAIVTKLIDYLSEGDNDSISKSVLLSAFFDGFSIRSALKYFGAIFLYILDSGIYKFEEKVSQLKVNEFSRILSYLFEINIESDEVLRFAVLRSTTKTIALSERYVQLRSDLIEYLPEVIICAKCANDDRRKAEVVKLFYLFISQLYIDYHNAVCLNVQELLPIICGFYNFRMKTEAKETLFKSVIISLTAIYPHVKSKDCIGLNVSISENQRKTLKKLESLMEMEIKERQRLLYKSADTASENCFEVFVKMSALIIYLIHWHIDLEMECLDDEGGSRRKIKRTADKMETVLEFVKPGMSSFCENWLAILAELLDLFPELINSINYSQILQTAYHILCVFNAANNLRNLRVCFLALLRREQELQTDKTSLNNCSSLWTQIVEFLLSESSTNGSIIKEKQLILQSLLLHKKMTVNDINVLLQKFLSNKMMRRTECIDTFRLILHHANGNGFDKTSDLVAGILKWIYESSSQIDARSVLLNVDPIDRDLIADASALAVINFLNEGSEDFEREVSSVKAPQNITLLLYKYNYRYVCIEEHGREVRRLGLLKQASDSDIKNCLLQNNYELLMRLVNFETTKDASARGIALDLAHLNCLASLMKKLIEYRVFVTENYSQCPLIKRIGLFLSHLELHVKNIEPKNVDCSDVLDILQHIEKCLLIILSNTIFLQYLESQPLEELIIFLGRILNFSGSQHKCSEFEDWLNVSNLCLKILASLCGSVCHLKSAFSHILNHRFILKRDIDILMDLIKILSLQNHKNREVSVWFVDQLKIVCQLYHNSIDLSAAIVELLPGIFAHVQNDDDCLENMLIILSSFIKKTYKRYYSTQFAVNIMRKMRFIIKNCAPICSQATFADVCFSVAKFISYPCLEVQISAINTISAMLDRNWTGLATADSGSFAEFSKNLMSKIDYKSLPTITKDNNLNSISVRVQLLVAIFTFSSFFQDTAIYDLAHFCVLRKLNKDNFVNLKHIAEYFNCTLSSLMCPYFLNLIQKWTENKYPISKFPYYLCDNKREDFEIVNIALLTSCVLMHQSTDDIKYLERYKSRKELLKISLPTMHALALPYLSERGGESNFSSSACSYIKVLLNNLKSLGIDLQDKRSSFVQLNCRTICSLMELYSDDQHFQSTFGFMLYPRERHWFNIEFNALVSCLRYYLRICGAGNERSCPSLLSSLISEHSMILVQVFIFLKEKASASLFPMDKLKSLHTYCTFAQLVIEAIESDAAETQNSKYFMRDIFFFMLHILLEAPGGSDLQDTCLVFIQRLLNSPVIAVGFCNDILKRNVKYLIRSVLPAVEASRNSKVRKSSIRTVYKIIEQNKDTLWDIADKFTKSEDFNTLREIELPILTQEDKFLTIIRNFKEEQNRGAECIIDIRNHISKAKSQLFLESSLICNLIRQLIDIIRNPKDDSFALEALKCLGEIGSLRLQGFSYYFEIDTSFYDFELESALENPVYYFAKYLLKAIDKMLINYNKFTHGTVCSICQLLVSSESGISLIDSFPYLNVFRVNSQNCSSLDVLLCHESPIDLSTILKNVPENVYEHWLCTFTAKLYAFCGLKDFEILSLSELSFAESSLIPIVKLLLSRKHLENILNMLDYFFQEAFSAISRKSGGSQIYKEKRIIKQFLDILECVRIYNNMNIPGINLLFVAKACNYCQAYFLSILYLELFFIHETYISERKTNDEIITSELFQDVSTEAYKSIGCNDAISTFLNPLSNRLAYLSAEGAWSDVLLHADATDSLFHHVCIDNLKTNGVFSLVNLSQRSKSVDYETCWRLCQWDTVVDGHSKVNTLNDMENEFQKHHFNALKCIFNREEMNSLAAITNSRQCVGSILKEISVECLQSVYKYLTWLQMLQQAEDFCEVQFTSSSQKGTTIFEKWKTDSELGNRQFWCKELLLSHQVTLFRIAGIRAKRKITEYFKIDPVELYLLKSIENCTQAGELNFAIRNIAALKSLQLSSVEIKASVLLEDAEICFRTGKPNVTKVILDHLIKNQDFAFCPQRVIAFRMHGEYLMESNTDTFETVLRNFFTGSIDLLKQFSKNKEKLLLQNSGLFNLETDFDDFERRNRKCAYETIAKYADREYSQLNIYINSDEFKMKCKIIEENRQAADSVGRQNKDRDKNIGAIFMKKFANLDEKEMTTIKEKCTEYLFIAIESYIKYCKIDEATRSPAIFRIIALLFDNENNKMLHVKIAKSITQIPSYKFLCALNQMTARLNSKSEDFLGILKDILVKCAQDHPHHTLYQLFALVYAYIDSPDKSSNERIVIAKSIINKAKNKSNSLCINQLEHMFPALIEFANAKLSGNEPFLSEKLRRMKNLNAIQCPTLELPIAVTKVYQNITSILKWNEEVALVGGINAPKKLTCLCSDGVRRPQLLKGKDDLRQDSVMQQVFSMINDLLKNEPESSQRKLKLRTYKVVPLSMRSGIIEWCLNTMPLGLYLAGDGKSGAHKKYRPNDYTVQKCRQMLMQHLKSDPERRLQAYLHICSNIKPVFHYFFLEKFLVPGEWFERRLSYINSVATTSIIGFILGIGDRHTQNILIDEKTAEVIHIDFGIAFEQGRIMPTPETVPFRLTHDIVAPMGVSETNGVFKKSCEATMRILRRNQAVIITILEVLLYDPLYIWQVVTQPSDEKNVDETNLTAHRALMCVQNKLEGKQAGIFGTSVVEVQVHRLINEAVQSENLCLMYPGWDPYL